ncbi:MAG: ribosomal protein S18-alanine N-acetyltransferase [Blastochloris sp.]|nr:ribosomal protein S18-alanine N-acetyltransferase [Blastochloris sp.]
MHYYIEPMREDDIGHVQEIERASNHAPWSSSTYRRELRTPSSSRYLVARMSTTPLPAQQPAAPQQPARSKRLLEMLFGGLLGPAILPERMPLAGFGGLWLAVDEAHITTINVAPAHRGRGVGELLLNGLVDEALDAGATSMTLEVRVSNSVAQNLYLKYGFEPAGTRKRYYTDNGEDALIMWTEPLHSSAYQARLTMLRQRLFAQLRSQAEAPSSGAAQRTRLEPPDDPQSAHDQMACEP